MMIDYLAEAGLCRTKNEFNRLHIKLDRILAPAEIARLAAAADQIEFPSAGRAWLATLRERTPDLFDAPEPFDRRALSKRIMLYETKHHEARRKKLLIAFTGMAERVMVQTHAFLQSLASSEWDVAIVKRKRSFLETAEGGGTDLDQVLADLRAKLPLKRYSAVTMLGTSAGGSAAVVAALKWGARRGVSICGAISDERIAANPRPSRRLRAFGAGTSLCFIHGEGYQQDEDFARAMSTAWGGDVIAVPDACTHNVLDLLLKRGELKAFLREVL